MSTQTTQTQTPRTPAQARAERAARKSKNSSFVFVRPVTDEAADALLPAYDRADAYPALSSRNLARRESRDAYRRDTRDGNVGFYAADLGQCANVNDANFNRAAAPSGPAAAALSALDDAEVERTLAALRLPALTESMVRLRLEGLSLAEIGARAGMSKQSVDDRLKSAVSALALFWLDDESCGTASVIRDAFHRSLHHALARGRACVAAAVCDCASHQFRVQRVKDSDAVTFHCEACKKKYSAGEYRAMAGGNAPWGD